MSSVLSLALFIGVAFTVCGLPLLVPAAVLLSLLCYGCWENTEDE